MSPALTLLIATSVGWSAPDSRPAALEIELMVVSMEAAVTGETLTGACDLELVAQAPLRPSLTPRPVSLVPPVDLRTLVTYDPALPYLRAKP